jgi:hypothetical protein
VFGDERETLTLLEREEALVVLWCRVMVVREWMDGVVEGVDDFPPKLPPTQTTQPNPNITASRQSRQYRSSVNSLQPSLRTTRPIISLYAKLAIKKHERK